MSQKGPNNVPSIIINLNELRAIFGEPEELPPRRTTNSTKEWIDAYNTQINRIIRGRDIGELKEVEIRLIKLLVQKYIDSAWIYILTKYNWMIILSILCM